MAGKFSSEGGAADRLGYARAASLAGRRPNPHGNPPQPEEMFRGLSVAGLNGNPSEHDSKEARKLSYIRIRRQVADMEASTQAALEHLLETFWLSGVARRSPLGQPEPEKRASASKVAASWPAGQVDQTPL